MRSSAGVSFISIILTISLATGLSGCSKPKEKDSKPQPKEISYKVKIETNYDKNGTAYKTSKRTYDNNGNEVELVYSSTGVLPHRVERDFDNSGNLIKIAEYREEDNKLLSSSERTYNSYGDCIEIKSYKKEENLESWIKSEYQYDKNGHMIHVWKYYWGNNYEPLDPAELFEEEEYEYDKDGNLIKITNLKPGIQDAEWLSIEYEYYPSGKKKSEKHFYRAETSNWHVENEYDDAGNIIKSTYFGNNGSKSTTEYKYDNNGNMIEERDTDGWKYQYEYDDMGNIIKKTKMNSDGNIEKWTEFEYVY